MTREAYKATEAVEFIAEHLQNEDKYIQVIFDILLKGLPTLGTPERGKSLGYIFLILYHN